MTRRFLLVLIVFAFAHNAPRVAGQCFFGFSDRPFPPECPYYGSVSISTVLENRLVTPEGGGPDYLVTQSRTNVDTSLGFCGSFEYPRDNAGDYDALGTVGAEEHSYVMTIGDAWCNEALLFVTCLAPRPSNFHPPSFAINVRPAVLHDGAATTTPAPPKLPLWDEGGYFFRTATVRINDSCLDPNFDPILEIRTHARATLHMSIVNGSLTYGFPASLNVSVPASSDWTRSYVTSRLAECPDMGMPQPECVISHTTCKLSPVARCDDAIRTRPLTRYPSRVRLACIDAEYGYVWRVDNDGAPGLHFDWRLTRTGGSLIDPIGDPGSLNIPSNTSRNLLFDDPLIGGFWPGTSGKHTAERFASFFIPTWFDDPGNVTRPSNLELYAGYPGHYTGTTTLGALVEFFNFYLLMDFDALDAPGFIGFTYEDVAEPAFPDDLERQILLHVCTVPGLAAAATAYVTGNSEDWVNYCAAAITNATATWPDALALTLNTFAPLNASAPDPMPACVCGSGARLCGDADGPGDPIKFQYDYVRTVNQTVDYRLEPVCRMPLPADPPLSVGNLPPYGFFPGPSSPINVATIPYAVIAGFYPFWPEPKNLFNILALTYVNYTTSPFGVMWNLSNVNRDPLAQPFTARLAFANTAAGVPDTAEITLPYKYIESNIVLQPERSRWLISRTLIGQNAFGHINWLCSSAPACPTESVPMWPPDLSPLPPVYAASSAFALIDEYLSQVNADALPDCECYVNIPCDGGTLLEETDLDVNVTALAQPPGPVPPPPSYVPIPTDCIPTLEACDCEDNNCDGVVDNVAGVNATCGVSNVGHCQYGNYSCVIPLDECGSAHPLVCVGAIYPQLERCDNMDWDCDGIINNVPGIGEPCGSDVGICEKGTLVCNPPNPDPICVGEVGPEPADICGNGLDDDCDGLIDYNCVEGSTTPTPTSTPTPSPPGSTTPSPSPSATLSPTPSPPPAPTPPMPDPAFEFPDITIPTPVLSTAAIIVGVLMCCVCVPVCLYCALFRRDRRWSRQRYGMFY